MSPPCAQHPVWFGFLALQEQEPFLTQSLLMVAWGWDPYGQGS